MRPSSRCLPNSATVTVTRWTSDGGVRQVESEAPLTYIASVQPMNTLRAEYHGIERGVTGWVVYLIVDPGVQAGDVIDWSGRTLQVLGPARDEAGRGRVWSIDCQETA